MESDTAKQFNSENAKRRQENIRCTDVQEGYTLSYDLTNCNSFGHKDIQSDIHKYCKDHPYCFSFDFGTVHSNNGESAKFTGDFPSFNTVGFVFDTLGHFSLEIEEILHKNLHTFLNELGFYSEDSKLRTYIDGVKNEKICYLSLLFAGVQCGQNALSIERIQPFVNLYGYILSLEETFESAKGLRSTWKETESNLYSNICETIIRILKGTKTPEEIDSNRLPKSFKPYWEGAVCIRKAFINLAGDERRAKPVIDSLCETLRGYALESIAFAPVKKTAERMSPTAFRFVRNVSITLDITLEMMCLLGGLDVSVETRCTLIFRLINHLCCTHSVLLNDIYSFRKEVEKGEELNWILIKNKRMNLEEAFKETLEELRDVIRDFKQTKHLAKVMYGEDKDLHEYIKYCEGFMIAHCLWAGSCTRYGDVVFEIIVNGLP